MFKLHSILCKGLLYEKTILFQINQNQPKRGELFNGYAVITFAKLERKGNVQGKFKQGFKLGRCFLLNGDNKISEIRGRFENDKLLVNKISITLILSSTSS